MLVHNGAHTHVSRFKRTGKRNEIFIATKFGAGSSSGKIVDGSPAYVKEACQKSLEKLGVDQIDLFYAHRYGIHDQLITMSWTSNAVIKGRILPFPLNTQLVHWQSL